jgi:hypothetical protein
VQRAPFFLRTETERPLLERKSASALLVYDAGVRTFLWTLALLPFACIVYTPDLLTDTAASHGSGGATQSSTGQGGCASGGCGGMSCVGGACLCADKIVDGDETDIDCGGPTCAKCADDAKCKVPGDCMSSVCKGTCQKPACDDMAKNGDETWTDCGGSCPTKCGDGVPCKVAADCQSGVCNGSCQAAKCGDGVKNGKEACDDNGSEPFDACSCTCQLPSAQLLLSEIAVSPTAGELIEIYNPTEQSIDLGSYYLADYATYYEIATGKKTVTSTDFWVRFPAGKQLAAGKFAVVSLHSATEFKGIYGSHPDYDFDTNDTNAPTMEGTIGSSAGLTDGGELVVLFYWDGVSMTVSDVDYVSYGSSAQKIDKSAVAGYKPDTPIATQISASAPSTGKSIHRCPTSEDSESKMGGNGILGHDETSESGAASWKIANKPSPGAAPVTGLCP